MLDIQSVSEPLTHACPHIPDPSYEEIFKFKGSSRASKVQSLPLEKCQCSAAVEHMGVVDYSAGLDCVPLSLRQLAGAAVKVRFAFSVVACR